MSVFQGSCDVRVGNLVTYHVEGNVYQQGSNASEDTLPSILRPIVDASHTRDRKPSPPNSTCARGTRKEVVRNLNSWARSDISSDLEPHIRWMYGYVGSGKSSISQEVCDAADREERPVISFFFFRNAGDRSKIWRLGTTLASQMAAAVPETAAFIRAAVQSNPALLAPDEGGVSVRARMRGLVYAPFKATVKRIENVPALKQGPLLIVLDGLDECNTKDEVQELIDGMLDFFHENPLIPIRVFITSRIEEHIQSRLNVPEVLLDNLVDHCSDDDITTFLDTLFEDGCLDLSNTLEDHSFSDRPYSNSSWDATVKETMGQHRWIVWALKMNPGLDGLYAQTLARSKHLPRFSDIISTIALLAEPLPTPGIAEILGVHTYEVTNVLVDLQAIVQVPGTDDIPVTLFHTSLRDFLTTQSRSGEFYAHPAHHTKLYLRSLHCRLKHLQLDPELFARPINEYCAVARYAVGSSSYLLYRGVTSFEMSDFESAVGLCREALLIQPGVPELIQSLSEILHYLARDSMSPTDWAEAVSLSRAVLELHPFPHHRHLLSLQLLSNLLLDRYMYTNTMADLEEVISVYRAALKLRSTSHTERSITLNDLASALRSRHRHTGAIVDLEEAIAAYRESAEPEAVEHPVRLLSLTNLGIALIDRYRLTRNTADLEEVISSHRQALKIGPSHHPQRASSLNYLGEALVERHRVIPSVPDLEEAISLHREAFELLPIDHPLRCFSLQGLIESLQDMYNITHAFSSLQEAIDHCKDLLKGHYASRNQARAQWLRRLADLLQMRYCASGREDDFTEVAAVEEEANNISANLSETTLKRSLVAPVSKHGRSQKV